MKHFNVSLKSLSNFSCENVFLFGFYKFMQHKLSELFPLCINWNILNLVIVSILDTLYTGEKKNQGEHNQFFFFLFCW